MPPQDPRPQSPQFENIDDQVFLDAQEQTLQNAAGDDDEWEQGLDFENLIHDIQCLVDSEFLQLQQNFSDKLNAISQLVCQFYKERSFITSVQEEMTRSKCVSVTRRHKFSEHNNMDPGPSVPELSGLTPVEQMLIAQVNPNMSN